MQVRTYIPSYSCQIPLRYKTPKESQENHASLGNEGYIEEQKIENPIGEYRQFLCKLHRYEVPLVRYHEHRDAESNRY